MVRTASTMLPLGTVAPDFDLPDANGRSVRRDDVLGQKGLLVVFMCNHCPYVKHVAAQLVSVAHDYSTQGIGMVGINSNDITAHPDDSPEKMKVESRLQGYQFPYLFDQTQEVAKAYRAACTPDFYLFDSLLRLVYRGQMDDSRPQQEMVATGQDLREAMDGLLEDGRIVEPQKPSIGCNIKWKANNEPDYFR